jgi:hypothetical protein
VRRPVLWGTFDRALLAREERYFLGGGRVFWFGEALGVVQPRVVVAVLLMEKLWRGSRRRWEEGPWRRAVLGGGP